MLYLIKELQSNSKVYNNFLLLPIVFNMVSLLPLRFHCNHLLSFKSLVRKKIFKDRR